MGKLRTVEKPALLPGVRAAGRSDEQKMIEALVRAFEDDPMLNWALRADEEQKKARILYFRTNLDLYHRYGMVFTVESRLGCSIWAPPDNWRVTRLRELLLAPRIVGMLGMRRLARGLSVFDRLQKEHPREPHYYLATLGVHPDCQAQGLGSSLTRAGLDLADRQGLGAYLETGNDRNLPFYRGHGFTVTKSFDFGPGTPTLWLMWRPPIRRN